MVASRQVEISFYRVIGRQRGCSFDALAQNFARNVIPFLRNYIVPAAKLVGTDLLGFEFAVLEIADVVSGRKNFKTAANKAGRQTLRKQFCSGSRKGVQAESFQQNLQSKPAGRKETFLQIFLKNQVDF